jgi:hypothetical protein
MARHVEQREVVAHERARQADEGEDDEHELGLGGGARQRHPVGTPTGRADHRQAALDQGDRERQQERDLAEFGDHFLGSVINVLDSFWFGLPARFKASAASGGM